MNYLSFSSGGSQPSGAVDISGLLWHECPPISIINYQYIDLIYVCDTSTPGFWCLMKLMLQLVEFFCLDFWMTQYQFEPPLLL